MQRESNPVCEKAYGCMYVKVGEENKTARKLQTFFPEVEAHAIKQLKHKSCNGVRSYSSDIMVPGYLLFYADSDMLVAEFLTIASIYHILTYNNYEWQLRGDDLFYAKWIFDNSGTIGISVVYMEGDAIKIIDGPLKAIEGKIIRLDKRNRNALVSLGFQQQTFTVWLAFEWMEKVTK